MSFHSKLRELYTKRSEHIFLHVDGDEISYYTVQKRADTISAFFRMQGCVPGSCIVYLHSSLRSYIEVMLACIQAGFTFYPLGAWQDEPDFFDTVKGQAPAFLFCDPDQLGCSPELLARKLPGTRIVLSGGSRPKSSAFLTYQQVVSRPLHFEPEPISADTPVIRHAHRCQVKDQFYCFLQHSIRVYTSSMGVRLDIQRFRLADGVSHADSAFLRQPRRHDVLGEITSHVRAAAIHLGAVLTGQSSAAVGNNAAVGVHHKLAPGQARVRLKAAQHKGAAGIDEHLGVLIQIFSQCRHKDELVDCLSELLLI